jgi:lipoprotein-anchoring transpeptidase ErfK/SrfK
VTWLLALALSIVQPHGHRGAPTPEDSCSDALGYQVLLDRLGFSPGEIDGTFGPNLKRALAAFETSAQLSADGTPDCAAWEALTKAAGAEVLMQYPITGDDVSAKYLGKPLPEELPQQAQLPALSYASVHEAIAERFHASPRLIARLNPHVRFEAGAVLKVPAVTPFDPSVKPAPDSTATDLTVEVSRRESTLRVLRADGSVALLAPVSSGSTHDPLPIGTWKVVGTAWMPPFHYNPDLFWDAEAGDSKAIIKPGPNNPVGVVWIDIDVPHYGMHGTPTPNLVGHAQSHGCVRLTNWDAARLAAVVKPGTRVVFKE